MISNAKERKLISIYLYVCDKYESELKYSCQRYSNNNKPEFTDQEILTIYLYVMHAEKRFDNKNIYNYTDSHLRSWFPKLPSYEAFNTRLNLLNETFRLVAEDLIKSFLPPDCRTDISLVDSLPIITCSGKRSGKVAPEITDKGFCSTKSMWFFGVRLHALAFYRTKQLPFPEELLLTPASGSDLNVCRQAWGEIYNRSFYGDKAYNDHNFFENMFLTRNSRMLTPVKEIKNQADVIKKRDKAANDLFSTAVSKIRQPIESFFNWLIVKTDIQRASRVRSSKGLLVHVFGRIAAAFIPLIFNS